MTDFMLYSIIFLWVGFLALLVVNFALLRQFGVLFDRVSPVGALAMNANLKSGDVAPEMSLTSLGGETLAVGGAGRKTFMFFLSPSCAVCKNLLPVVQQFEQEWREARIIYASAGDDAQQHEDFLKKYNLPRAAYVISDQLGMVYGVSKLPYAVLIDEDGKISSLGLVNTREHIESLREADMLKVGSLQEYLSGSNTEQLREQKDAG